MRCLPRLEIIGFAGAIELKIASIALNARIESQTRRFLVFPNQLHQHDDDNAFLSPLRSYAGEPLPL